MPRRTRLALVASLAVLVSFPALALAPRSAPSRYDALARTAPGTAIGSAVTATAELAEGDPLRSGWEEFDGRRAGWQVWLDPRSGLPSLAAGPGIRWDASGVADLEVAARAFLEEHAALLGSWRGQLQLDPAGSGRLGGHAWQLTLRQVVDGVPVEGAAYDFHVIRGNLAAFGARRLAPVRRSAVPRVDAGAARASLEDYLGGPLPGEIVELEPASLRLLPVDPEGGSALPWRGARGEGYRHLLVWRFVFAVPGEPATWVAEVDADSGAVVGLHDETRYGSIVGGVFPVSDDGLCPTGCEQPGWPMPYADYTEGVGAKQTANDQGLYTCTTSGATIRTTLSGPYIEVSDTCGPVNETVACDGVLDLEQGPGTDCAIPAGSSPGNTHASRSSFYHLNRSMEKGRAWLPDNTWLRSRVVDNVNINSTCNAFWNGSVNFYRSGGGCRNTGEIAGVFVHEWGHGLDANDGGGYDNPSEAYADVVAFLETRESCVGRGFFIGQNCGGYGDACLNCTGIRDQDWDAHARHEPATPGGFIIGQCPGGGGPCGKEVHCESYLAAEVVWDLAVRDLPAAGVDPASAWQLTEKLFYLSRKGSGGGAYNCAGGVGNGCGTSSWYHKFRVVDDDDGNLANGTPHGAAIYAAFARHGIACGAASDASNQSSSSCPPLPAPDVAAIPGSGDVEVTWSAVPGAVSYTVLRTDIGCDRAQVMVGTVPAPGTAYVDDAVSPNRTLYYRVQAATDNPACQSPVSECASTAGQPFNGRVRFDAGAYGCTDTVGLKVVDGNVSGTVTVDVASDTETVPETVTLTETTPGSHLFLGSIAAGPGAAVPGDGKVTIAAGDLLLATYHDADTGSGSGGLASSSATVDCAPPRLTSVRVTDLTDESATVRWTTDKPSSGRVDWGPTAALGRTVESASLALAHALTVAPLDPCARFHFRVTSVDANGNAGIADVGGAPFQFNAWQVPGVLRLDDFESPGGWTLEGEWQIGAPQGKGTPPDPALAFKGTGVLGHDLTGLGAHPGDYEAQTTQRAISPVIDASSLVQGQLRFRRWLNVYGGIASVKVRKDGVWNQVWSNYAGGPIADASWSAQVLDISAWADGNPQLQIAFEQSGGPNAANLRSGWNVDRMLVKAGNLPDADACGQCGGAPSFAGARAAEDLDPCGDTGVRVSWDPASSWGTGRGGTYAVHRGSTPDFLPSAGNRIALGLTGTSLVDAEAPNDVPVYYAVRAENDETCGGGPHNGGTVEDNLVRVAVTPTTARSLPSPVGGLAVSVLNATAIHLAWDAAPGADRYTVQRSSSPSGGWELLGTVPGQVFDDLGAGSDGATWYYTVRGENACGQEGP